MRSSISSKTAPKEERYFAPRNVVLARSSIERISVAPTDEATRTGKREGASVGAHKVILKDAGALGDKFRARAGEDVDMSKGQKVRISGKYSSPQTTSITKSVEAGKKNEFVIQVTK